MLKINDIIDTGYGEIALVGEKEDLVKKLLNLNVNRLLNWWEIDDNDVGTCYCAEVIKWQDSLVLLIGGYGGETLSAWLDEFDKSYNEYIIRHTVNEFFKLRFIDELIAIEDI